MEKGKGVLCPLGGLTRLLQAPRAWCYQERLVPTLGGGLRPGFCVQDCPWFKGEEPSPLQVLACCLRISHPEAARRHASL